jgi:hypothetical protein
MDAKREVELNDLQMLIRYPVVALIRRHRRDQPITIEQIRDQINFWLDSLFPGKNPYGPVVRRDIEKVNQHLSNLPWPKTIPICSHSRGCYIPSDTEEIDTYISQLESRLSWIGRRLKHARRFRKEMALGTGTPMALQPEIFCQQIENLPGADPGGSRRHLLSTTPPVDGAGGIDNKASSSEAERIEI